MSIILTSQKRYLKLPVEVKSLFDNEFPVATTAALGMIFKKNIDGIDMIVDYSKLTHPNEVPPIYLSFMEHNEPIIESTDP